ncbi:methyltransferase [Pseudoalteromonas sp. T1lg65]|uniref:methyltransferase n=1 Tax=Pseudoalteromonas sp. T1lg65 TaxID=2077101 RepID=UPI003F7A60C0
MSLLQQFLQLDALLRQTKPYWQLMAFQHHTLPWLDLAPVLEQLSDQEVNDIDSCEQRLHALFLPYIEPLVTLNKLCHLPHLHAPRTELPFWLSNGVKGRKLAQLQDFVSAVDEQQLPVLEWCAGKGHLGRLLAFHGAPKVDSVELQAGLCEQGRAAAKSQELAVQFHCADVLNDQVEHLFNEHQHGVALHACGQLHRVFLTHAVTQQTKKLSLSPCCYHLFTPSLYQSLSQAAQTTELALTHHDMKLALQETVTAPARVASIRKTEVSWRLGFDALRKDLTGEQSYISVPSVNKAIFSTSFKEFCEWASEQKQLPLPTGIDYEKYQALGEARKRITDRIELVRHLFRRPIEMWLVLDRALYLQEAGYDVRVSTFCDKRLTPRNILIQATK